MFRNLSLLAAGLGLWACNPLLNLAAQCRVSADCADGLQCAAGLCIAQCVSDSDCPTPLACAYGACQRPCSDSSACGDGTCGNGYCVNYSDLRADGELFSDECSSLVGVTSNELAAGEVVLLGTVLPATGTLEAIGPGIERGVQLAVEEINRAGGIRGSKLGVVQCDSGSSAEVASKAIEHLRSLGTPAVIGPASSAVTIEAFTAAAKEAGMLVMSPASTAAAITQIRDDDLLWRTVPSDALQGVALAEHLVAQGFAEIALVTVDSAYGNGLRDVIVGTLIELGVNVADPAVVVSHAYADDASRWSAQHGQIVTSLAAQEPDVVVLIAQAADGEAFLKLARNRTPIQGLLVAHGLRTEAIVQQVDDPSLLCNALGTAPAQRQGVEVDSFAVRHAGRFGGEPAQYAMHAYDATYALAYAAAAAIPQGLSGARLAKGLRRLSDGEQVNVGTGDFGAFAERLGDSATATIDLRGTSGELDWNEAGEPAGGSVDAWAYRVDQGAVAAVGGIVNLGQMFTEEGAYVYSAPSDRTLPGTGASCAALEPAACIGDQDRGNHDGDGTCDDVDNDDDGDGWSDAAETACGSDPLHEQLVPADRDGDGVCNPIDACTGDDSTGDTDGDGLCNDQDGDDDGDGWSDTDEAACLTDPLLADWAPVDSDRDGTCDAVDPYEDYVSGWANTLAITIQAHLLGLSADVTMYPLALRLDTARFASLAADIKPGGADIRFSKPDGAHLPFEIEHWVDGSGGLIWVLVDSISATRETVIQMHYNNPTAVSASDPGTVFATSRGFQGVWHLSEDDAVDEETLAQHVDSTANDNTAAQWGNASSAGVLAGAQAFDGEDDVIYVESDPSLMMTNALTLSAWFKLTRRPAHDRWFALLGSADYVMYVYNAADFDSTVIAAEYQMLTGALDLWHAQETNIPAQRWVHAAATFDGSVFSFYVDGKLESTEARPGTILATESDVYIGGDDELNLFGSMDEARIYSKAMSADWMTLDYATQRPGQNVVAIPLL